MALTLMKVLDSEGNERELVVDATSTGWVPLYKSAFGPLGETGTAVSTSAPFPSAAYGENKQAEAVAIKASKEGGLVIRESEGFAEQILQQLKVMNFHLSLITNVNIDSGEV